MWSDDQFSTVGKIGEADSGIGIFEETIDSDRHAISIKGQFRPRLMPFPGTTFETELAVRPDDLDMFQHVHSTIYLDYVLAARFDQMDRFYGMSMQAFLDRGLGWVVRKSFIEYKRPLKLGERMIVRTRVEEMFKNGVKVWFEILRLPDRKLSCDGWCDYTLVTLTGGRATGLPEDVISKYSV